MVNRIVQHQSLHKLADIQPGYPFRGKLPLDKAGDAFVVQYRHVIVGDALNDQDGNTLDRVALPGRKQPDYLKPGDIIFMAKGSRNNSVMVGDLPENTVCTPNFYRIRLGSESVNLLPEFLSWQLNHGEAQRYFVMCSQGTLAPSITKTQLADLPVVIPSMEQQRLMVELAGAANREKQLLTRLIENRQHMIEAVGHQLLRPEISTKETI